ncbi:MAG: hypothetical protein K2H01_11425, partial [Ruminococcus sp.]|nr:hypothetical protein [Ruminococcus sp.]
LILLSAMLVSMSACGTDNKNESLLDGEMSNQTSAVDTEENSTADETVGQVLFNDFQTRLKADPYVSIENLTNGILSNSILEFEGVQTSVSEGLLAGFGNAEITDFKEGMMFAPVIGSIPFVGYIFVLDNESDAPRFTENLKNNADLRWNICTEADEMIADYYGNTVFFVMCPRNFE